MSIDETFVIPLKLTPVEWDVYIKRNFLQRKTPLWLLAHNFGLRQQQKRRHTLKTGFRGSNRAARA
jgi:hypothetical protein